ncbi:glutamate--cysteine ligase [Idiomarina tyrosinivorans]|uniref:Glutamate--cysteine ligase n=1 Tax=Idiomarina tyrosinivorans TaxID=1445662 RepID=A0A432ZLQ8_9GAMM|nr:glutamate--cysteine ligase [Idiomarina tyrosinivorans]RUO78863.1 glutamate--cysteine ligase [Idiomarina tyrosinivorans]
MQAKLESVVNALQATVPNSAWSEIQRGVERETLRINQDATLAQTDHPSSLGKTLTHPTITTDYSECLLEFITPVERSIDNTMAQLRDIHRQSYRAVGEQLLWPMSMPCYVGDEKDIPIARYGNSHSGRMKSLYRKGLTHRYGGTMQIIAGVHYNFSVPQSIWDALAKHHGERNTQQFRSARYFGLIRNFKRVSWVIPYLFGASPAVCKSFLSHVEHNIDFKIMGKGTAYRDYATSLRMSDLGYTNKEQASLQITYNSVDEYIAGLRRAISTKSTQFSKIGVKVDGEYRQLNDNILQIENEFYSPIRPKRVAKNGETPTQALERGGVEYIEVRALDANPFSPVGITAEQIKFLDLLLLYCLFSESAPLSWEQQRVCDNNFNKVVLDGRNPRLSLQDGEHERAIADWLEALFYDLGLLAQTLDQAAAQGGTYQQTLAGFYEWVLNPELTLSGQWMALLKEQGLDNSELGMQLAKKYRQQLLGETLEVFTDAQFEQWREASEAAFAEREKASQHCSFDEFLADYFTKAAQPAKPEAE